MSISESYDKMNAKAYDAESYDDWDNKDDDKWTDEGVPGDKDRLKRLPEHEDDAVPAVGLAHQAVAAVGLVVLLDRRSRSAGHFNGSTP